MAYPKECHIAVMHAKVSKLVAWIRVVSRSSHVSEKKRKPLYLMGRRQSRQSELHRQALLFPIPAHTPCTHFSTPHFRFRFSPFPPSRSCCCCKSSKRNCKGDFTTSMGPTIPSSPSPGNLPSLREGILMSGGCGLASTLVTFSSTSLRAGEKMGDMGTTPATAVSMFRIHSASTSPHFFSVKRYVLEVVP